MVLSAKILNSDATLNSFFEIASLDFVPGSKADLVIRLNDSQRNERYVPPSAATLTVTLNNTDGTTLVKSGAILDSGDRSMWKISLSALETVDLLSGNFLFTIDVNGDTTLILKGLVNNGLRSLLVEC